MIRNYLRIAVRVLQKKTFYATINVFGLAVGMACCLLIGLYVLHERSYDRFHDNPESVYRIAWMNSNPQTRTPHPMAQALVRDFPQVIAGTSLTPLWGPGLTRPTYTIRYEDQHYDEKEILAVDSTFLDVFSFEVLQGDAVAALRQPGMLLMTASTAQKYFGTSDPIGKTVVFNDDATLTVGAIVADVPPNAHFHFDLLISYTTLKFRNPDSPFFGWGDFGHYNYIRLASGFAEADIAHDLPTWSFQYLNFSDNEQTAMLEGRMGFDLQPLTDIHLHSHLKWELAPNSHASYIYVLTGVALFILVIACINFMNLSTARSMERAKEVGMRKALGANRGQLIMQFLGESILLSILGVILAVALLEMMLPVFHTLTGVALDLGQIAPLTRWAGLLALGLGVGLLAGCYPAFYLSAFKPIGVLKGSFASSGQGSVLRKGLVVFQFTLSILLIVGTGVIRNQISFMQATHLGLDTEQVVVIPIKDPALRETYQTLKATLHEHPHVLHTTAVSNIPGGSFNQNPVRWTAAEESASMSELRVDYDFIEAMGLELVAGRGFSEEHPADLEGAFILNEEAVRQFEWTDPIGQELLWDDDRMLLQYPVIGVVKDFHFKSLHETIAPLIIQVNPGSFNYLLVKISPERIPQTLAFLETEWTRLSPGFNFEYSFLDTDMDALYAAEVQVAQLVGTFAGLAVLIACLGLFGLAAFTAEQRTKEMGIRKVLGASPWQVVVLLSREFAGLVVVAFVLAFPIAYLTLSQWLQVFPYRTALHAEVFIIAGVLALVVACLTVSYQALRVALTDPVNALRYE